MSVVVGVDGSASSSMAIRAAAEEARMRRTKLIAVLVYQSTPALGAPAGRPAATLHSAESDQAEAQARVRGEVDRVLGGTAGDVEARAVAGLPGRTLVEQARETGARLIVLARRGGITSLLGTVVQHVLRNAPCPVLVVPVPSGE